MSRRFVFDPEFLAWAARLAPEDRLRQAHAAFKLYHQLHSPFRTPFYHGFDTYEEFNAFTESRGLGR